MTPVAGRLFQRIGFEVELLAPPGASRRTLASELAGRCGGSVVPVWHHDSEPSLVPGLGRFLHLTQGFRVLRDNGTELCTLVDDVTIRTELDPRSRPVPGWHRILSDDPRLLRLLAEHSDPGGTERTALDATAALWRVDVQRFGGIYKLDDAGGATIALAAPQGAERERPCEIVTPPLTADHRFLLNELLSPARKLGFTVPVEAAVHLHLDGGPFRSAASLANVIRLFAHWRSTLRSLLETNPACRRLAPLPAPLVAAADDGAAFEELATAAAAGGLTKYFDINLTQLFAENPIRDTIEVRILPGAVHEDQIMARAVLIDQLLARCQDPTPFPLPPADPSDAERELLGIAAAADRLRQPA